MNRFCLALACLAMLPIAARAQGHSAPARGPESKPRISTEKPPDHSREPFVIEQYFTTARFENDGTGERDIAVKARVQTEAGAQQLSQIVFPYNSASEQIDVRYVRVRKVDGKITTVTHDAFKDVTASIARDARAYSDCKEKYISVPALVAGDTLEYEISTRIVAPAQGQFWFEHRFLKDSIVLDERLAISVPASKKIVLKSSASSPYQTETANGRITYRWKRSNLAHLPSDSSNKAPEQEVENPPDVQVSTFASWQDVARWYANLSSGPAESSAEIRAKTEEITQSRASQMEKIQAIYDFISKNIRYVDIPFGTAAYQPHRAAEILANGYADSNDEHVLLAAMLDAAGIWSEAAFISYRRKLDASLPSPAQFDHLVTAVPLPSELVWMDSTPGVAPFRLLASPLRDKSALLVSADGGAQIVKTPADPPFVSTQDVHIDGEVSDLGKLTAHAHYTLRGDTEFVLRLAFHKTPEAQWTQLGQTILSLDGIQGEVSSVKPSDPMDTKDPFALDIAFTQSNFVDWSAKRAKAELPLLAIGVPSAPAESSQLIHLGSPLNVSVSLKLALPAIFAAQPPVGTSLTRDYAEYRSSYRYAEHTLTAQRSLEFKMRELPASRAEDYDAFTRAVTKDETQPLALENSAAGAAVVPASATADELLEAGLAAFNAGNAASAVPLFERLVQIDPRHKSAWNNLGLAHLRTGNYDAAIAAFQKQLEVNPSDQHANDYLGLAYQQQRNYPEAIATFRKQVAADPLDSVAHAALGEILLEQHEYAAAVSELDKATILSPENAGLRLALGSALLNSGDDKKALAAFEAAAQLSPTPLVWNNIAYNLADRAVDLDKAQHYAESAISATEADLQKIELSHLTPEHLSDVANLGAYWDTLGWVYFRKIDLASAERYVRAAWMLDQSGEIGDHLAQIDEQLGQKARAIHDYALALAVPGSLPETRAKLTLLLGGNTQIDTLVEEARPELAALRRIPAGKLDAEDVQADFLILLSPGEKSARVEDVRFIGGSDRLKPFSERLRSLDYGVVFPNHMPVKLVRRATLACAAKTGDCTLTLIRPEDLAAAYKSVK
jgi:tetratricopeptide (TPR) repeat protein/transglutaminase-like putative cysteine protease